MRYVALLRGINVGGNTLIKMADLKICFEKLGYQNITTYINSGNVLFEHEKTDELKLAQTIAQAITKATQLDVKVVVINQGDYANIIKNVPKGWGEKGGWKYNLLFLIPPYNSETIMEDIGELKPEIEQVVPGEGVIYQAISFERFGRATSGKLASRISYKQMTIRNWNTSRKLLALINEQ